ncbi:hypothetical protein ACFLUP_04440 [Chloroflexota bacterium]
MTQLDWIEFAIEYRESVDVLLDEKTWRRNFTVFPTIFLFRHYIELRLKEITLYNWEYLEISQPFPKGHDLYELWKICKKAMMKTDKLVDPQFAESQNYIKEIIQAYNVIEDDLKRFAEVDPDSQHSRYPVDSQGNPIAVDKKLLIELQHELPELVERIVYSLDGISTGIHTILQDKYDALSQQKHP